MLGDQFFFARTHLTDRVGSALREADAGVRALAVDAGGAQVAVVVEVAAGLAALLPRVRVVHADLAERAVGGAAAARQAHAVVVAAAGPNAYKKRKK